MANDRAKPAGKPSSGKTEGGKPSAQTAARPKSAAAGRIPGFVVPLAQTAPRKSEARAATGLSSSPSPGSRATSRPTAATNATPESGRRVSATASPGASSIPRTQREQGRSDKKPAATTRLGSAASARNSVAAKPSPTPRFPTEPDAPVRLASVSVPGGISVTAPTRLVSNQAPQVAGTPSLTDWKVMSPGQSPEETLAAVKSQRGQGAGWKSAGTSGPPSDLTVVPKHLCLEGKTILLRRNAAKAVERLIEAAARDGVQLIAVSGYRDFGHQVRLYRQAVARYGPRQKMVARPGLSEHQMGDTVDFGDAAGRHVLSQSFGRTPEGQWLRQNGPKYGWHLTVKYEPWHARYKGSSVGQRINPLRWFGR